MWWYLELINSNTWLILQKTTVCMGHGVRILLHCIQITVNTCICVIALGGPYTLKPNNDLVHYTWEILSDLRKVGGFLRVLLFRHQYNWPTRYNWNIVESGVKYHNPNPSPLHVSAPKDQVVKLVYQWNYWNVLLSFKSDIISLSNLIVFLQFIDRCLFFRLRHKWFRSW